MDASLEGRAAFREKRFRYAVGTSLLSKVLSLLVQLISYPMALKALGAEAFGVYAVLTASMSWINMGMLGIGPSMTIGLAKAVAADDIRQQQRYVTTGLGIIASVSLVLLALLLPFGLFYPVHQLYGEGYAGHAEVIRAGFLYLTVSISIWLVVSNLEAINAGFQQYHITNGWAMASNAASFLSIYWVATRSPGIFQFILAVYLPPVISRCLGLIHLLYFDKPHIRPRREHFSKEVARDLIKNGAAFLGLQITFFLSFQLTVVLAGRLFGPHVGTQYAMLVQLNNLGTSIFAMLTQPMLPALTDAWVRHDVVWVRRIFGKLLKLVLLMGGSYLIVMGLFGQQVLRIWQSGQAIPGPLIVTCLAAFMFFWSLETLGQTVLTATDQVARAARIVVSRAFVGVALTLVFSRHIGPAGPAVMQCLSFPAISLWSIGRRLALTLKGAPA